MKKSELRQIIREELYKELGKTLTEDQKSNIQSEMKELLEKAKIESKRITQLMRKKGYNV
jgi:hypothetical protein